MLFSHAVSESGVTVLHDCQPVAAQTPFKSCIANGKNVYDSIMLCS